MSHWESWFAWYPVRAYGYATASLWRGRRWVWLRRVEWTEGHTLGDWLYRLPYERDPE